MDAKKMSIALHYSLLSSLLIALLFPYLDFLVLVPFPSLWSPGNSLSDDIKGPTHSYTYFHDLV